MNFFHTGLASDMACEETLPMNSTPSLPLRRILMSPLSKAKLSLKTVLIAVALVVAGEGLGGAWRGREPRGRVAIARREICCTNSRGGGWVCKK